MKIGIVIPVVSCKYIGALLDCIAANTVLPHLVLIIDNSSGRLPPVPLVPLSKQAVETLLADPPLGVNASWNYGIKAMLEHGMDLISIFNDDIEIERFFFEKLLSAAERYTKAGAFCPYTTRHREALKTPSPIMDAKCYEMAKREGWAFTLRASVARRLPEIPVQLRTFCGDDWLMIHCKKLGHPWYRMVNNRCFHHVGGTVRNSGLRGDLEAEKRTMNLLL